MIFLGRTIALSALLWKYESYIYKHKEELPLDAAEFSMRLFNTRKLEHALKQANEIKGFLRLK